MTVWLGTEALRVVKPTNNRSPTCFHILNILFTSFAAIVDQTDISGGPTSKHFLTNLCVDLSNVVAAGRGARALFRLTHAHFNHRWSIYNSVYIFSFNHDSKHCRWLEHLPHLRHASSERWTRPLPWQSASIVNYLLFSALSNFDSADPLFFHCLSSHSPSFARRCFRSRYRIRRSNRPTHDLRTAADFQLTFATLRSLSCFLLFLVVLVVFNFCSASFFIRLVAIHTIRRWTLTHDNDHFGLRRLPPYIRTSVYLFATIR